jgi:hypothetical protein
VGRAGLRARRTRAAFWEPAPAEKLFKAVFMKPFQNLNTYKIVILSEAKNLVF